MFFSTLTESYLQTKRALYYKGGSFLDELAFYRHHHQSHQNLSLHFICYNIFLLSLFRILSNIHPGLPYLFVFTYGGAETLLLLPIQGLIFMGWMLVLCLGLPLLEVFVPETHGIAELVVIVLMGLCQLVGHLLFEPVPIKFNGFELAATTPMFLVIYFISPTLLGYEQGLPGRIANAATQLFYKKGL